MLIFIFASGLALFGLIAWFYTLEVKGQRHVILVTLVITMLVEAILAGPASEVPIGILRPQILRQDFRPPDAVIVAALIVRTLQLRGDRVQRLGVAWGAFIAMYIAGTGIGILNGLPVIEVLFQGKAAFYLVGGMVVGSGVDLDRLHATIWKIAVPLAFLLPIAFVIKTASIDLSFETPVQRFNRLGRISNDTVTLFTLIGVVALMAEVTRRDRRVWVAVAAIALLLSPAIGRQRASYLVVAAVVVAFGILVLGRTWSRRASASGVEMGLVGIGLVGLVFVGLAVTASPGVITEPVTDAFGGQADANSAQARVSLYNQAFDKIGEQPIIGSGVGTKVTRVIERTNEEVAAAAHNILLDIALRVGLFGLALYLGALWSSASHAIRLWKRAASTVNASMAMAGLFMVIGVFSKSLVEPALDKFRLSLMLGIGVGLILAAHRVEDLDGVDAATSKRRTQPTIR